MPEEAATRHGWIRRLVYAVLALVIVAGAVWVAGYLAHRSYRGNGTFLRPASVACAALDVTRPMRVWLFHRGFAPNPRPQRPQASCRAIFGGASPSKTHVADHIETVHGL